jgi:GAF domain
MEEPQTWQELLRSAISDPLEHQRIAREMKINPVTLTRWANRSSMPRLANLRPLLDAMPRQRQKLQALLQIDYPKIVTENILEERIVPEIPSAFYSSILNIYTTSPPILRSSTICVAIFQQILRQLDPLKQGLQVAVCQCVHPSKGEKVRSLRFIQGRDTPPWEHHVENFMTFLGLESQIGNAVGQGHVIITHTHEEHKHLYPAHEVPYAQSTATYPLLYFDQVAGALAIFSTQRNYFTPAHMELMQNYAELLVLAFEPDQFYPLSEIGLGIMPPNQTQQPYLRSFQSRVTDIMIEAEKNHQELKRTEAELQVWKELEGILLRLNNLLDHT